MTGAARPWWHTAAVYQVYPRSFRDGNGDGLGDLQGVIDGLPYLADLGVDAIWLSPFYPSPQRDSGYDVADPRDVDPVYGTLADAERLIAEAHARGIRVIVDVVPNHVSSEHRWFREAIASPPGSPARSRFHVLDGRGSDGAEPPTNWMSLFGGPAWTRLTEPDGTPGQWYLHLFDASQPDLNWANPEVLADSLATLRFWLDRGVDGFRVDVALALAKDMAYPDMEDAEGLALGLRFDLDDGSVEAKERRRRVSNSAVFDRDEVQEIYREWRRVLDGYEGDRMAVCEAWLPPERAARYMAPDTLHQVFNFDFLAAPYDAQRLAQVIGDTLAGLGGAPATWVLSNHDSPRVPTRLGGGEFGLRRARALALVAHALPGSVYVYQGEELGLADAPLADADRQDPVFFRTRGAQLGRDAARVPLPWSGSAPPYGFTDSECPTWLPQPADWAGSTVEAELADPASTLAQYRAMLRIRRTLPDEIAWSADGDVLTIARGDGFACIANTGTGSVPIAGEVLVASERPRQPGLLGPYAAAWVRR